MSSPKQLARIAGVFYLLVGIFGGFAEGFVDPKLHVAGNAGATAANVVAKAELVRMGVVAHLVDGVFFALTAMALYLLLNHVHKNAARSMVIFVVIAVGMICLNAVFLFEGMQVATDPSYATAFGVTGSSALVMVLLDIQHYGTLAAQVFFRSSGFKATNVLHEFYDDSPEDAYVMQYCCAPEAADMILPLNRIDRMAG